MEVRSNIRINSAFYIICLVLGRSNKEIVSKLQPFRYCGRDLSDKQLHLLFVSAMGMVQRCICKCTKDTASHWIFYNLGIRHEPSVFYPANDTKPIYGVDSSSESL